MPVKHLWWYGTPIILMRIKEHYYQNTVTILEFSILQYMYLIKKNMFKIFRKGKNYKKPSGIQTYDLRFIANLQPITLCC